MWLLVLIAGAGVRIADNLINVINIRIDIYACINIACNNIIDLCIHITLYMQYITINWIIKAQHKSNSHLHSAYKIYKYYACIEWSS